MTAFLQFFVAAILGLLVFPGVFGNPVAVATGPGSSVPLDAAIWLALAVVLIGWLVVIAPRLVQAVRDPLNRVPWRGASVRTEDARAFDVKLVARVLVAVTLAATIEAILRRPLVAVVGSVAPPLSVDAVVAAVGVLLILALLLRLYLAARPFVEGFAWLTLDALVPTSGSEVAARRFESSVIPTQLEQTTPVGMTQPLVAVAATVPAWGRDTTRPATGRDEPAATVLAATEASGTVGAEPTLAEEATVVAAPDATLPGGGARPIVPPPAPSAAG